MEWYKILGLIGVIVGIAEFGFNVRDRYKNWIKNRKAKKKEKDISLFPRNGTYQEDHPNFDFSFSYISNSRSGNCQLSYGILNRSNSIKFMEMPSYHFEYIDFPEHHIPSMSIMSGEQWPKRLEHGQRFHISIAFESFLINGLFDYWHKRVQVYVRCHSTTGDFLKSRPIEFDVLAGRLVPISNSYHDLGGRLSNLTNCTLRDIETSLWQLQIFGRLTVHIAKQFAICNIPIADYLRENHNLDVQNNVWHPFYRPLEQKQIPASEIIRFLQGLL